jgi:hypothetical protein
LWWVVEWLYRGGISRRIFLTSGIGAVVSDVHYSWSVGVLVPCYLSSDDQHQPKNHVEGYYTASLLLRGFKAVTIPAGVPSLDFPKLMQDYLKHDGCLLISDDPNSVEIADNFELTGKPVWRSLAEVPRAAG